MQNTNHLLLMLHDGARTAERHGEHGLASVLDAMTDSLVLSIMHQGDFRPWRQADLHALYKRVEAGR